MGFIRPYYLLFLFLGLRGYIILLLYAGLITISELLPGATSHKDRTGPVIHTVLFSCNSTAEDGASSLTPALLHSVSFLHVEELHLGHQFNQVSIT